MTPFGICGRKFAARALLVVLFLIAFHAEVGEVRVYGAEAGGNEPVAFTIGMPILASDVARGFYGIWPFGVHGSGHALDGHPGWDVEFKAGASVRAAADGTVQSVLTDTNSSDKKVVQIQHTYGKKNYRTVYTNISTVADGIVPGARVSKGQIIGTAGSIATSGGALIEKGTLTFKPQNPLSTVDFLPEGSSSRRLALCDIVEGTMRIDWGTIGGARPADLSGASVYKTESAIENFVISDRGGVSLTTSSTGATAARLFLA